AAGARGAAEMAVECVRVGPVFGVQCGERGCGGTVDLECLVGGQAAEGACGPERRRHQVPRGRREAVEQEERMLTAQEHELGLRLAEDAPGALVYLLDVLEAPGRPERLRHEPSVPRTS